MGVKSPLTGGIKESNVGGTVAQALAKLGIGAVIIEGKAPADRTFFLTISADGSAELIDARNHKGMRTYALVEKLCANFGEAHSVACIGPAGDFHLSCASIQTTDLDGRPCRAAGRGGLGAVMGAKGLKAMIVSRQGKRPDPLLVAPEEFKAAAKAYAKAVKADEFNGEILPQLGTACLVEAINGANIIAMDAEDHRFGAMAVKNERIAALGDTAGVNRPAAQGWATRDLGGRTVLPGFIDTHEHLMLSGSQETAVHLDAAGSIAAVVDRMADRADQVPRGEWVYGSYLNEQDLAEKRMPTRDDLDRALPDHPVFIMHATCHLCALNTRGLDILAPLDLDGLDKSGGMPTGVIRVSFPSSTRPWPALSPRRPRSATCRRRHRWRSARESPRYMPWTGGIWDRVTPPLSGATVTACRSIWCVTISAWTWTRSGRWGCPAWGAASVPTAPSRPIPPPFSSPTPMIPIITGP